ncbi:MAG: 50S ribosomal protein L32 [Candidatus Magasanikbacteria bacterium]|nr:50S ribosomal protein L32 [Candidatus Magasanikbacteria bacterium]
MGLPSKRRTRTSKRQRASHFALKESNLRRCDNCKSPIIPHQACGKCGNYRGRTVLNVKKRTERSLRNRPRTREKMKES